MPEITHRKKRLSSFKLIVLGFAGVILLGALILMLPFSSTAGVVTPFHEALFTSTSAVCVTGLVVQDTGSYWSAFGQTVILLMIQIGGLGVVTVAAFFAMLSGRKISLMQRSTMQDAISAPKVGGIVRLTRFIVRGTFLIELIGMIVMLPTFCGNFGIKGIWMAAFHSISAFCNAGFDILGTAENKYPSLTGYIGEPTINIAIMLLIIVGGIGFLTWDDIYTNKWHFKKYRMQSKVILVTTAILIIAPAVFFFFCDFTGLPLAERILASLFQSVTPRTAGFNTVDLPAMTGSSKAIMILLMLVGGLGVGAFYAWSEPYRRRRLLSFRNPFSMMSDEGYQLSQSLIAFGSGGIFGMGLGMGRQKYAYLPYPESDFIFAIVGEDFGLLGCLIVVALFVALMLRGMRIAMRCPDKFGTLLAAGITSSISVQAVLNMGVVVGILPTTGLPLPFFSAGGTSISITMAAIGILLNISRESAI